MFQQKDPDDSCSYFLVFPCFFQAHEHRLSWELVQLHHADFVGLGCGRGLCISNQPRPPGCSCWFCHHTWC